MARRYGGGSRWRCTAVAACLILCPASAAAEEAEEGSWLTWKWSGAADRPNAVALSGGYGTEQYLSRIFTSPWNAHDSGDRMVALTLDRELGRIGHKALGFGVEGQYAFHWGRAEYNEWAFAVMARWYEFPWNEWIVTTFAFGLGPSYTNIIPPIEADKGITTKVLNQADLEFTFALPSSPWNQLFFRLEHRSGVFGLIDGAGDGSNFLTLGYRYHF